MVVVPDDDGDDDDDVQSVDRSIDGESVDCPIILIIQGTYLNNPDGCVSQSPPQ